MSITTPVSAATPANAINPTTTATDRLNPSHQTPTNQSERQRQHDDEGLGEVAEIEIEHKKMIIKVTGTTTRRRVEALCK